MTLSTSLVNYNDVKLPGFDFFLNGKNIWFSLTLSNRANNSSRAGLMGNFKKVANSSMVIRPPLQEVALTAKPSSSFFTLSHFRLCKTKHRHIYTSFIETMIKFLHVILSCSYLSLRLILVNSTRPASMGRVSSPAEIIRRQSSYVWSVTETPKTLKAEGLAVS